MPKPRKQQISLDATPYYHCTSRCVRRAFLCGVDHYTGQSYEHRRQWVEERILFLASLFAIDMCAYAVMSNHLHVVLHVDTATVHALSDKEVVERWHRVFKGSLLTHKFLKEGALPTEEWRVVKPVIEDWRLRLMNISWFMRALNEPIARRANAEDKCSGAFWESRFSSQALLDERALAACMAYVDLNPVRAKLAETPEASDHTSIRTRLEHIKTGTQAVGLAPFVGNPREAMPRGLPFELKDYVALVDWTGRIVRDDKRGAIDAQLPPILARLGIAAERWLLLSTQFEQRFKTFAGDEHSAKSASARLGYQRCPGRAHCRAAFS